MNTPFSLYRMIVVAVLASATIMIVSGCRDKEVKPAAKDTLTVGMELSYPPFEMTDEKGEPTGISVDLAKELGKSLGKRIIIQNTAFDGLIAALKSGKIDLIISSMTITDERRK